MEPLSKPGNTAWSTYKLIALFIHVVLQVALAVVGGQNAPELAITSEVEAVVGSVHQQAGHIAPANQVLEVARAALRPVPEQGWGHGAWARPCRCQSMGHNSHGKGLGVWRRITGIRFRRLCTEMLSCTQPGHNLPGCQISTFAWTAGLKLHNVYLQPAWRGTEPALDEGAVSRGSRPHTCPQLQRTGKTWG